MAMAGDGTPTIKQMKAREVDGFQRNLKIRGSLSVVRVRNLVFFVKLTGPCKKSALEGIFVSFCSCGKLSLISSFLNQGLRSNLVVLIRFFGLSKVG